MSKTAMQELIEKLEWYRDNELLSKPELRPLNYCINTAKEFVEKEKEQIVKAFNASEECTSDSSGGRGVGGQTITTKYGSAESYYNQTFNT